MDIEGFLARVLPAKGHYVAVTIDKDATKQYFMASTSMLAKVLTHLDAAGCNTYYGIAAYGDTDQRTQANVQSIKTVALDIDCGDKHVYPTWKEAIVAVGKFVTDLALPTPMIVHSGRGLHVYWTFDKAMPVSKWQPVAVAMKAAAKEHALDIDPVVTSDSARILRAIGTTNRKSNTKARMLLEGTECSIAALAGRLLRFMAPTSTSTHPAHHQGSALSQALVVKSDLPPANADTLVSKCQQIRWAVENQEDVPEPFWYALLGIAAYTQDPQATAISWSEKHPNYNKAATLRKLAQWQMSATGPTTCKKFEELRPDGCKGCKFYNKITTPVQLGIQFLESAVSIDAPDQTAHTVPMPRPFKRTTQGVKISIDGTDLDVCSFDIYPTAYGYDASLGYETVRYKWDRKHVGWQPLVFRQANLTNARLKDFTTDIADQGIVLPSVKQTEYFQIMLRSYMDELRQAQAMTNIFNTMGWKDNYAQFVLGDTLLRRNQDGTVTEENVALTTAVTRSANDMWCTAGTLSGWTAFTSLLDKADLRAHKFALAVGLSAPLYAFTGLKGLTVSLYGPTGTGKTLAQYWVQSIYGNPDRLHFASKFTQNSLFSRLGSYCHLPVTVDEVTLMEDRDAGDFAYWVSQGRDKARLNQRAEERDAKTWALPVIISTNRSFNSKLVASGLETDAQLMRILEIAMPPATLFQRDSTAGRKVYDFLHANYGHAGAEFIKRLVAIGPDEISRKLDKAHLEFPRKYKCTFSGDERFWQHAVVLADMAAELAKEWGLIAFDHRDGIEWVLAQVGVLRRAVTDFKMDTFDLLSEYLNAHADSQIQVYHVGTAKPTFDFTRLPRGETLIRFDFYRRVAAEPVQQGVLLLSRTPLRQWLSRRGADYKTFIEDLVDAGIYASPKSNKAYLTKDTPIKTGQAYVVGVNLNHARLRGIMTDADDAIDNLQLGQIRAVG